MMKETKGLPRRLIEALSGEALAAQEKRWAAEEREQAETEAGLLPRERQIIGITVGEPTLLTLHCFQGIRDGTFGGGTITENDYAEIIALLVLTSRRSYYEVIMPMWRDGVFHEGVLLEAVRELAQKLRPVIMGYTVEELASEIAAYWGERRDNAEKKSESV